MVTRSTRGDLVFVICLALLFAFLLTAAVLMDTHTGPTINVPSPAPASEQQAAYLTTPTDSSLKSVAPSRGGHRAYHV